VRHPAHTLAAVYTSDLKRSFRTAEIAYRATQVRIVKDRRLRESDYGATTRCPTWLIANSRGKCVDTPFPKGASFEDVADRVREWLEEIIAPVASAAAGDPGRRDVLVIGHRAVFFALEHLLRRVRLPAAVRAAWQWQPGWEYVIGSWPIRCPTSGCICR
jgi:broad specificity phosphatase PhoE